MLLFPESLPRETRRFIPLAHGPPMGRPWISHGFLEVAPWVTPGNPTGLHWVSHEDIHEMPRKGAYKYPYSQGVICSTMTFNCPMLHFSTIDINSGGFDVDVLAPQPLHISFSHYFQVFRLRKRGSGSKGDKWQSGKKNCVRMSVSNEARGEQISATSGPSSDASSRIYY